MDALLASIVIFRSYTPQVLAEVMRHIKLDEVRDNPISDTVSVI